MKNILLISLLVLSACATKPKHNTASFAETPKEVEEKLENMPPLAAPQEEFEGYKVNVKDCSFLRTMYLDLSPLPESNFALAMKKRIEPNTIMGMSSKKQRKQTNPCSRLRPFKDMKSIAFQGPKDGFGDKGYLVKAVLGIAPKGQAYLQVEFFKRHKKDTTVRTFDPGHFLTFEQATEMTDDELAEWIVSTLYHVGWK